MRRHRHTPPPPPRAGKGGVRVLAILDSFAGPLGHNYFKKDTSHLLLHALARRGRSIFYAEVRSLFADRRGIMVRASSVTVLESEPYFLFHEEAVFPVHHFHLVLMRKDPPVDLSYLYAVQLLSSVPNRTRVINHPRALQNWNEKLVILNFPKWIPPTLVSANKHEIDDFVVRCGGRAVLKPLEGFGGKNVRRVSRESDTYRTEIEEMTRGGSLPVMAQAYLDQVTEGEKRIFMIDGRPLGTLLKIPPEGSFQTNPDLGGRLAPAGLSKKERRLCEEMAPFFRKNGIFFAGVDTIGEKLTEINITSPGLLWELNEMDNQKYEDIIVDLMEKELRK